jgi:hypothetical protein
MVPHSICAESNDPRQRNILDLFVDPHIVCRNVQEQLHYLFQIRIIMLHPDAGGAEVFTHEVMRRLTKKGYDTTLFTERFSNSLQLEYINGVAQSISPARPDLQGYGIVG